MDLGLIRFAMAACCLGTSVLAQAPSLFKGFETLQKQGKRYESYEGGLRLSQSLRATTDFGLRFESILHQTRGRDYGDTTLENTRDRSILTRLTWDDAWKNQWFVGTDFSQSRQGNSRFSASETIDNSNQTSFSLVYGWKRQLLGTLDITLYSGVSTCFASGEGQKALLPVGGVVLSKAFDRGLVSFEISNKVEGNGMASGVYGSQKRREARVSARYDLGERVTLSGYCLVSHVDANFDEAGSRVNETPLVTASVDVGYRWTDRLSTKLSVAHRAYLGDANEDGRGPMGGLSIHYLAF